MVNLIVDLLREAGEHLKRIKVTYALSVYLGYLIIRRLILRPLYFSPLRHIPGPTLGNPFIGQSKVIIDSESGIPQSEWAKKYGPVVRIVGPVGIERLMFMKPDALHQIMVKDWLDYPRPNFLKNILGLVLGHGLLTVTGDEHRQMRKAMNPAFSIPNLMTDMFYSAIDGLIETLSKEIADAKHPEQGEVVPIYDWMSKVTLDIICESAFGYKSDSIHDPHNELALAYDNLLRLQSGPNFAKLIVFMLIPGVPRLFASKWGYDHKHWFARFSFTNEIGIMMEAMYIIKKVSAQMLKEKMEDSAVTVNDINAKRDIMSILVRARKADLDKDSSSYAMSDKAMMDQVLTFLGAGHETTASGLSWSLWLLANDQESQHRLRAEVSPLVLDNPHLGYRTLKELQWLDCVVMESLRVMPPVPLTVRKAKEASVIQGVFVPKGTLLTIPIRPVNIWKEVWGEDAEEFHPARWLNPPKDYHPVFSMFSFVAGPHACIGKTMAIVEMKAVLAAVITHFEFEPAFKGQTAKPATAITMKPTDGMPLRIRRIIH